MKYPPAFLDEIRARLPVSSVVGQRVRLQKSGREWKGLSPFNAERTPSFYVNDQKGFYYDFSSGKHGDVFTFLMDVQGLSFPEAVEQLANSAGLPLPRSSPEADRLEERRRNLFEIMEIACKFFETQLQLRGNQLARDYLSMRRISEMTQAEFRIGFAPDARDVLKKHMLKLGVPLADIERAGLIGLPDDGREAYDRFRGRIIIPIQDDRGRVIAFGGRAIGPDAKPKYLNSPETELFEKGRVLFNSHRARRAAYQTGTMVVVEGYLDAIAVYQEGFEPVVASMGTAFTEEQIAAMWRFASEPVVCFDGDKAGQAAAYRAIDKIVSHVKTGYSFSFGFLPQGQDPDELIRSGGLEKFRDVIENSRSFWDVLWARETETSRIDTPDQKAIVEKRLMTLVGNIKDPVLQKRYRLMARLHLSDLFWKHDKSRMKGNLLANPSMSGLTHSTRFLEQKSQMTHIEEIFLGLCIEFPDLANDQFERIATLKLEGYRYNQNYENFRDAMLQVIDEHNERSPSIFYAEFGRALSELLDYIHGRADDSRESGYNLRRRFPILACHQHPGFDSFIESTFEHFLRLLQVRDLERQVAEFTSGDFVDDSDLERLIQLKAYYNRISDEVRANDLELAERASTLRTVSGRPVTKTLAAA